jgi:hypothetical protein
MMHEAREMLSNTNNDSEKENDETKLLLSAKRIVNLTQMELNYQLSFNAFTCLKRGAIEQRENGLEIEQVNAWILRTLQQGKEYLSQKLANTQHKRPLLRVEQLEEIIQQQQQQQQKENNDHLNGVNRQIDIVQMPSNGDNAVIMELEGECERLKKIIQIILNKQAELA